ncbi:hypothetical protein PBY51_003266 [Eleginops maclovinus]|uniref:Uncharacterized protein n=1 Tax=Eleginops maclovinus TaxID=56733 RepID=A0AAN8ALC8_ELEMC|nr:hypothetical protein PBY51_003266 [Eleginops maclovinus]
MNQMILLCVFVVGLLLPGVQQVRGIQVYTASEVEAFNGTDVKLRYIFSSGYPVGYLSVSWMFRPLHGGPEESVFYYNVKPYLPSSRWAF